MTCPNCQAWQEAHDAQVAKAMRERMELEDALSAFACIGQTSARRLGLLDEWRIARRLTGLEEGEKP